MKDAITKHKNKEKKSNNIKNSLQNKSKIFPIENKSVINNVNKKRLVKKGSVGKQIPSKFYKLEFFKDNVNDDLNKSETEDDYKKYHPFNSDRKIIQNSVSKYLITKILEINTKESLLKNDTSNAFLNQKEDSNSNYINSLRSNRISINNNPTIIEYLEESKISGGKNENIHIKNKNTKKETPKNKNNIIYIGEAESQDFRKNRNIKLDSGISFNDNQNENEHKYSSCITDNLKSHLTKTNILLGLHQISEKDNNQVNREFSKKSIFKIPTSQRSIFKNNNNDNKYNISKRQMEITKNIMELDLVKLKKEVYDYENTDVTDAINRLPTHKFDSDKNNNKKNKHTLKHFKRKKNKDKNSQKNIKNIKEKYRILRKVGYVYDSLDDEECEDEEDNNFYFEPNGIFILILDFIILISSLLDLIFFPIHLTSLAFNERNLIEDSVFIFIDIIYIIDLISGFFKAYINFDEELIKNSVSIIQNYLKTWFLLDFLCSIPVYSILKEYKFEKNDCYECYYFNYNGKNLYHLFGLIKLLKIIKVFKINIVGKKIKHKIIKINFFYYWGNFIKQVFIFISILNLSSCLFIFSARNNYPNWIINLNMNINNFISIYICSFYYIITTMTTVGYGDIQIFSMTERIFEILFLIIGTCLYSWMLTSASNYIQKMNEKNIKFEQKIEILDDIKKNYPIMNYDLYRRIYKLLYYQKCHEEADKNIIIDSLPYSIKIDLLIQMYYPIITNFKFFRYFKNSEFIIEIVSVLKPLVGMKGDLLLNEGDYVEDIIFNKSGILSLEIYIDLNNPYEFIEKYLIKYNLENIKNKNSFNSNTEFNSTYRNNSFNSSNYSKNSLNFNKMKNSIIKQNNNINLIMRIKDEKSAFNKGKISKKKFQYLKIINIREKEHFGDVLMFLNEPSPLNLRVISKNAEVLLLSKTDVVKISSNFPDIWNRINESSLFNLEQIKILIMRKLSIFCNSNNIKIKSLDYKKDTKTCQNKINYSLITIPDSTHEENINQNTNIGEDSTNKSKNSENSSQNFENSNTYIIKEVQSSEESGTNSMLTKIFKYSYENNTTLKKGASKKMSDSINVSNLKEFTYDENIHNNRFINKYSNKNIIENQNQFLTHSKSYNTICHKKNSSFSNKYAKNTIKTTLFKINTNIDNMISYENSPKNLRKRHLSNSPIIKKAFNRTVISIPKRKEKNQNFDEKSKMNKRLLSIPLFNFIQNHNNSSSSQISEFINDEIYPHENFEIKIPDNDQNLIIKNNQEKSILNSPDLPKKLLSSDKKNSAIANIKNEEKLIDISKNLNSNNKFNNLKISYIYGFEIKSSYDNINKFTENRFISDNSLIKKTKIFLSKECGLLNDINTRIKNISYYIPSPIHNRVTKSKSTIKLSKCLQNKKSYDHYSNSNLSIINGNGINSPLPFSKELKKLGFKKSKKDNEKFLENSLNDVKKLNKSFVHTQRNATIKERNILFNRRNSTYINDFNNFSPKKGKRKADISLDNLINIRSRNKLDLITENMKRDNQNLNNPNEFYADLFNNFYKQKIKKEESKASIPKIKLTQNANRPKNLEESEEDDKDKDNCFGDN